MEITASDNFYHSKQSPWYCEGAAVKLFCVLKCSVRDHYKRRGEVNRKHPYTIII